MYLTSLSLLLADEGVELFATFRADDSHGEVPSEAAVDAQVFPRQAAAAPMAVHGQGRQSQVSQRQDDGREAETECAAQAAQASEGKTDTVKNLVQESYSKVPSV